MNAVSIDSSNEGLTGAKRTRERRLARPDQRTQAGSTLRPAAAQSALNAVAAGYWAVFWLMNGLDKFLNRSDLGWINWYGKDRSEQFGEYFSRLNLAPGAIDGLLVFTGIWEFLVALPLIAALAMRIRRPAAGPAETFVFCGYLLTGVTLIGFSAFDIVVGDRAELREHGLYLALLFVCCLWNRQPSRPEAPQSN